MGLFRKTKDEVGSYLDRKWFDATTKEGRDIVREATALRQLHPDLSGPELIRLAYWGVSGANA